MGHLREQVSDLASHHDEEVWLMLTAYNADPNDDSRPLGGD